MADNVIQFVPRSNSKTLLEVQERKAAEFLAAAPALSLPSERAKRMIAESRAQYYAIFPDDLREVGERIIRSPEFQDEIAKSEKDDAAFPFDPVCVAIMRGHGPIEDTAPCEMNPSPDNLA